MHCLSKTSKIVSWFFQIAAALILAKASSGKFIGTEESIYMFDAVGMGDAGRIIIGGIEGLSAFFLLTSASPHLGALLGFGTMLGALLAHILVLGISVKGDGGQMIIMCVIVLISTSVIMFIRRRNLPLIGYTCE